MAIKLFRLSVFFFIAFTAKGQTTGVRKDGFNKPMHPIPYPQSSNISASGVQSSETKNQRDPAADRYILDNKKMASLFKAGKIPSDFPGYNKTISYEENKTLAIEWMHAHQYMLTKSVRKQLKKKELK
ncbi:MAG: hypothetical protein ACK454_10600 [Flavobacteriales bacterium]|jgi:hypothetical protein